MVDKEYDMSFDNINGERPFMIYPKVFGDNRGSFAEVLSGQDAMSIKQINRSMSCQMTVRGMHAQRGQHCQSKIVEALTLPIYDIITDARPDSNTFGRTAVYLLDPMKQNKLYVPHGFLHGFAVPYDESKKKSLATFMYYCDETYCVESEMHANPMTILPEVAKTLENDKQFSQFSHMFMGEKEKLILSKKDLNSMSYEDLMNNLLEEYSKTGKIWYK